MEGAGCRGCPPGVGVDRVATHPETTQHPGAFGAGAMRVAKPLGGPAQAGSAACSDTAGLLDLSRALALHFHYFET